MPVSPVMKEESGISGLTRTLHSLCAVRVDFDQADFNDPVVGEIGAAGLQVDKNHRFGREKGVHRSLCRDDRRTTTTRSERPQRRM
jgi:hypothetical protein